MWSLYDYLVHEEETVIQRITNALIKKLHIDFQLAEDAKHEVLLALMQTKYDPFYDNASLIAYAYKTSTWALVAWRRSSLLPATITRTESPEPVGVSLDGMFGAALEDFIIKAGLAANNPYETIYNKKPKSAEKEYKFKYPNDPKGKFKYKEIIRLHLNGFTNDAIAQKVALSKRTVQRRIKSFVEYNRNS